MELNGRTEAWEEPKESPIPPHPLGIKPLGNLYLCSAASARASLGSVQALPDEILVQCLEFLDVPSLLRLECTCKFLFAFCRSDDLWRALFLE